ncbi:hypothetical protein QBC33DRAFT_576366 [Phialemonium atrogriseum]|uniref:Uncharacterized protein n=1 Tax=Phialemonium atrogriseum TaxID=1093897 RepID=A0AAJ0C5F3_9PEZI|nr:uncharacterized protein QBC33DRAFT_576366 [Phialemonium atrogriseum]KAK1769787.1 hypothetical protein QBC33DRAFT_576366 [Phialemonium atrogriseum]
MDSGSKQPVLPLLRDTVNLNNALEGDDTEEFLSFIEAHREDIEALLCRQLDVPYCRLGRREMWKTGSFNIVIPAFPNSPPDEVLPGMIYIRFSLPYKISEEEEPGNVDEKVRSEAATYIWLQENCPDVPIPSLLGFGLPGGQCTDPSQLTGSQAARVGVSNFEQGRREPLHVTWEKYRHGAQYRANPFRHLCRILLSMNALPFLALARRQLTLKVSSLANRPLTLYFHMTYGSIEPYIFDLLRLQDSKLLHQPNAIHNKADGEIQAAALTGLCASMHHFLQHEYCDGPSFMTLTEMHQTCSQLVQMQLPPYWLSSRASLIDQYVDIYEGKETKRNGSLLQAPIMRRAWDSGSYWFFHAVTVPKGMYNIFQMHIRPLFEGERGKENMPGFDKFWPYWAPNAKEMIEKMIRD